MNYLYLIGAGFIVSLATIWILGKKGNRHPGGSLACGMVFAQTLGVNIWLGALCGLVGYFVMLAISVYLTPHAADKG